MQNIKDQFTKLNIAYSDLKKEILFKKIKSVFYNEPQTPKRAPIPKKQEESLPIEKKTPIITEKETVVVPAEEKESFDDYADRRSQEIAEALKQYKQ